MASHATLLCNRQASPHGYRGLQSVIRAQSTPATHQPASVISRSNVEFTCETLANYDRVERKSPVSSFYIAIGRSLRTEVSIGGPSPLLSSCLINLSTLLKEQLTKSTDYGDTPNKQKMKSVGFHAISSTILR